MAILPSRGHAGQVVVAGQSGGLFRATDSGLTFERVNYGLDEYATVHMNTRPLHHGSTVVLNHSSRA